MIGLHRVAEKQCLVRGWRRRKMWTRYLID